jgi:tryptophan 2,3-dioxygenase
MASSRTPVSRMTYSGYLQLDELLKLQSGPDGHSPSPSNDEMHFIITHQTFELWFKQIRAELDAVHGYLSEESVREEKLPAMVHHLERVIEIFRLLSNQWKVMETLSPQGFLAFRDRLGTSSGFESWQMRALEMRLGLKQEQRVADMDPMEHMKKLHSEKKISDNAFEIMKTIATEKTLNDLVLEWLSRTPINGSVPSDEEDSTVVGDFISAHLNAMKSHADQVVSHMISIGHGTEESLRPRMDANQVQVSDFLSPEGKASRSRAGLLFIESYPELPLLSWPRKFVDAVVQLEQSMLLFRHSHARMVERMIGRRMGTGGSSGVDYLDKTATYRIFKDLWAVRTMLLPRKNLADVVSSDYYGFNSD